jgi:hypothetical protein
MRLRSGRLMPGRIGMKLRDIRLMLVRNILHLGS